MTQPRIETATTPSGESVLIEPAGHKGLGRRVFKRSETSWRFAAYADFRRNGDACRWSRYYAPTLPVWMITND